MGTNYYYFTKNKAAVKKYFGETYRIVDLPDFGYRIHVAKTSYGWLPVFQAHENCRSVGELLTAYNSGEFRIIDEYENEFSWEKFDEYVLRHSGGVDGAIPKQLYKSDPLSPFYDKNMPDYYPVSHFAYGNGKYADLYFKDPQGYEFTEGEFA